MIEFTQHTFPAYKVDPFHAYVASHLDRVVDGEIDKLMIFAPPQSGKSLLTSVHFPAFWLGRRPHDPLIITSYGSNLAQAKSRNARAVVESSEFEELFPTVKTDPSSRAVDLWELARPSRSQVRAAGVGAGLTGHPASCFVGETMVATERGGIDIQTLAVLQSKPRVWAYDHTKQRLRLCRVVAVRESTRNDIVEVVTKRGRSVRATSDHPFYVQEQGYRAAALLYPGAKLGSAPRELCSMREEDDGRYYLLHGVLPEGALDKGSSGMRMVRDRVRAPSLRFREDVEAQERVRILQSRMYGETLQRAKLDQNMCYVWETDAGKTFKEILLEGMSESSASQESFAEMSLVRTGFPLCVPNSPVLFEELCKCSPFGANEGEGEFKLQDGDKLCQVVCGDASPNIQERQSPLCAVRERETDRDCCVARNECESNQSMFASYRRGHDEQPSLEHDNPLQEVPYSTSSHECDEVALVRHLCGSGVRVYDIQVEGCRNFFAEGLLVHNCGIIDDPVESWATAQSERQREVAWEWYQGTFRTRVWENGAIVLIQTRWHIDDLAGMLLQEQGDEWTVLRLPAIAEEQDERDFINDSQGLPVGGPDPLGREPGEPLTPTRFSKEALLSIKKDVGSMVWAAEYQGAPVLAEGNMFKRDWFHIAERVPDGLTRRARYWDFAASKEGKARTSGVLLSIDKEGIVYIEDSAIGFWSPKERSRMIRMKAEQDHAKYSNYGKLWFEQEPGSSGKEIAQQMVREMAGYTVRPDRPTGDKDVRLQPFRAQAEGNNVRIVRGPWNKEYLNEMCAIPNGRYRDQADATAGVYNMLAGRHITVARFDNVSTSVF